MFIVTEHASPVLCRDHRPRDAPAQKAPFALPGVVRWNRDDGMGVQFGLIGARETHAITELTRPKAEVNALGRRSW